MATLVIGDLTTCAAMWSNHQSQLSTKVSRDNISVSIPDQSSPTMTQKTQTLFPQQNRLRKRKKLNEVSVMDALQDGGQTTRKTPVMLFTLSVTVVCFQKVPLQFLPDLSETMKGSTDCMCVYVWVGVWLTWPAAPGWGEREPLMTDVRLCGR